METSRNPIRWRCSGCGSPSFSVEPEGNLLRCAYCHTAYPLQEMVCPQCGTPYISGSAYCPSCGFDLVRECRACGAANPYSARVCRICGQNLDILDAVIARAAKQRAEWLREVREEAARIKALEEEASQARMAEMWEAEKQRLEELARARAERDRQQRIIMAIAIGAVALFLLIALIMAFYTTGQELPLPRW